MPLYRYWIIEPSNYELQASTAVNIAVCYRPGVRICIQSVLGLRTLTCSIVPL